MRRRLCKHYRKSMREYVPLVLTNIRWQDKYKDLGTSGWLWRWTVQMQKSRYFLLTIKKDCVNYVRKCHKCQIHGDRINTPLTSLFNMTLPWHFDIWGLNLIGLINLKANNRHRFILEAINYFTKCIESNSYAHVK
jgi:hypothetical protein